MNTAEAKGQIEWFEDLREVIRLGQIDIALECVDGAIDLLKREMPAQDASHLSHP